MHGLSTIYLSICLSTYHSSAAGTSEGTDEEKNQESKSDKERGQRAGQRGRGKRAEGEEGEDLLLTLFKEDIGYQREADEMREAESRETGLVRSGEKKPTCEAKLKMMGFHYLPAGNAGKIKLARIRNSSNKEQYSVVNTRYL